MRNITNTLKDIYLPKKALLLYAHEQQTEYYIEAYDMDNNGSPINARPLTAGEAAEIAQLLLVNNSDSTFLQLTGLLPKNVLFLDRGETGCVVWHTPCKKLPLFFKNELGIPCAKAYVPALLWKATRHELQLFALADNAKPTLKTTLYYAPFFNIYDDGRVCMGTVDIDIADETSLQQFMKLWEQYFFNSYFSHTIGSIAPVIGNIVQVWKEQLSTGRKFPAYLLKKHPLTIKKILP